jgi:hypothetical protein
MFDRRELLDAPLDLLATSTPAPEVITLKDFLELTSHLPKETPLVALVFDDDEVEYAKNIVSAAVRVEKNKSSGSATRIELKVQPDY